ncbi:hypothetical protein BGW36DRAFT_371068 [Talaromyces proteolyticus]|uniref:Uncharacterized protein n=1 Tax=Talaromyces proteolyticus TaxID=1131652 RepID=A0AAD4KWC7_9EURO|nr:uncharacterized protein BGW36DRAFT_371068 [Talaromyces proteolyticus]KAH8701530.1 hypothetical protein BGW36DRAFT_371068 [Talaromyces proteolyticus]
MRYDKLESLPSCPNCENELQRPSRPHQQRKYWVISICIHFTFFLFFILVSSALNLPRIPPKKAVDSVPVDHDAHLVGNYSSPLNNHASYKIETRSPDDWDPALFFGEPSFESDTAWNNLIRPRSFRVHRDEAVRLNLTDSILVQPGEDFATELGIIHNLHCLRRIRQMLNPEYYYPDASEEELEYNRHHNLHCLESIRTSMLCYPDINPHPYFWSGSKYHPVTVSGKVTRRCVDWEGLQPILEKRNFEPKELMRNTGPPN